MRALLLAGVMATTLVSHSAHAAYIYAGNWILGDGPEWDSVPPMYSGQSAAALLFGGIASDYAISTISAAVADINHMAYYDGYAADIGAYADTFSASPNNSGLYDGEGAYSAFVLDHTCSNRYEDLAASCSEDGTQYVNYAFRLVATDVPEPASLALLGLGAAGIVAARRRRAA